MALKLDYKVCDKCAHLLTELYFKADSATCSVCIRSEGINK